VDDQHTRQRLDRSLVLGVGNVLMGDEGIGVLAARHLEKTGLTGRTDIIDGGTGGFQLLGLLQEYPHVIIIDAALDGRPPGTVRRLRPRFASDFPRCLSAHDIGLRDLVEAAALLGDLPRIDLVTVSIDQLQEMGAEVSAAVAAVLPEIENMVRQCLLDVRDKSDTDLHHASP
jgi:hydrogenase maturation protease